MTFPFKYKPPFRELFEVLTGRDGKLGDIKDFHSYMKQSFNPDIVEKYSQIKPIVIDNYFAFISECQKDSGLTFDEILWNFIEKFIRHQVFDGKDTMEMKPLRSFYDPLFKANRLDPEALWSAHCGAAATTATVSGLVGIVKQLQPKGTPLTELLKAALPKNKPLKPPPLLRMPTPRKNTIVASTAKPEIKIPSSPSAAAAAAEKEKAVAEAKKTTPVTPPASPSKKEPATTTIAAPKQQEEEEKKKESVDNDSVASNAAESSVAPSSSAVPEQQPVEPEKKKEEPAPVAVQQKTTTTTVDTSAASALLSGNRQVTIQTTNLGQQKQQQQQNNTQQQQQHAFVPFKQQQQQQQDFSASASNFQLLGNNNNNSSSLQLGLSGAAHSQQLQQLPQNVPSNIVAALQEIDSRQEKLRAELDKQISAVSSIDGFLGQISSRISQFHRENPLPSSSTANNNNSNNTSFQVSMKQEQEEQLAQIRQKMSDWCKVCNFELEKLINSKNETSKNKNNKLLPQYVSDLGKQVESGKMLEHLPNEDFGEIRLQELLLSLKKDESEFQKKEDTARKLEELALQEELLKLEILKMEHDHHQQQQQQQNQNQRNTTTGNSNNGGRSNSTTNNNSNFSPVSPIAASPSLTTTSSTPNNNNNNLSIAQRIAARVQSYGIRGGSSSSPSTANFVMPSATISSGRY